MVTAYPVHGKAKSLEICRAFVEGCGGAVVHRAERLASGPAFFYGVDDSNVHLYREARERGDYYYADNSYFDAARQSYFRVTKNALQHSGKGESSGVRFAALNIPIKPWREGGKAAVVCLQSDHFMKVVVGRKRDWFVEVVGALQALRPRIPITVRDWNRDKAAASASLPEDLKDAKVLVTWSSAAAVTALLDGVPVVVSSQECAAAPLSGNLYRLDELPRPERENWAGVLADNQWSIAEMRSGMAWTALQ